MEIIKDLISNKPLIIAAIAWFVSGVLKVLVELRVYKRLSLKRVMGAGGMPSSHTATVVALMVSLGAFDSLKSPVFALAVIFTIVVIHDAVGVRLETGKQSKVLNAIINETETFKELDFETQLKEYVGHTPSQALMGAIVGLIVALVGIVISG